MLLQISGERLLREVQKDFNRAYPFLKIEFFKNDDVRQSHYLPQKQLSPSLKIKEARYKNVYDGEFELTENMSVYELENKFMDLFGLSIQVFRRSGNLWLETSMTDNWSLKRQNENGEEISVAKPS